MFIKNLVSIFGLLSTYIFPPCAFTSSDTIDKPKPLLPIGLASSHLYKRSNIYGKSFGKMPLWDW
jgi:hypothetical protein